MATLQSLKQILTTRKSEFDKLTGQHEVILEDLKQHGFTDIKQLEPALIKLDGEIIQLEAEYSQAMESFVSTYADLLNE